MKNCRENVVDEFLVIFWWFFDLIPLFFSTHNRKNHQFCTKSINQDPEKFSKINIINVENHQKTKKITKNTDRNTFSTIFDSFLIILQLPWLTLKSNPSENTIRSKIMSISMKKSLIWPIILKNFRLAAGPLPGDSLSGEQSPTAHCVGAT